MWMQMETVNGIICSASNPLGNRQFSFSSSGKLVFHVREALPSPCLQSHSSAPKHVPRGYLKGHMELTGCLHAASQRVWLAMGCHVSMGELPSREASKLVSGLKTRESFFFFFNLHMYTMLFLLYQQWINSTSFINLLCNLQSVSDQIHEICFPV